MNVTSKLLRDFKIFVRRYQLPRIDFNAQRNRPLVDEGIRQSKGVALGLPEAATYIIGVYPLEATTCRISRVTKNELNPRGSSYMSR